MKTPRRSSALATSLVLVVACLALAACGGSSGTATAGTANASTAPSGATGPGGPGAGRFAALRQCLAKQGITLPQRPAGVRRPPGGGSFGGGGGAGGATGPGGPLAGVNAAKFRAALQKCGGAFRGFRRRLDDPGTVTALKTFVSCMQANGIKLPAPNTSGSGPVFNTAGVDTTSAKFRAAYVKCAPDLPRVFGRGATGASGPTGTA